MTDYFYRATCMHSADYAVARCLPVRPSVCPSHTGIVSKRLYISSKCFFTIGYPNHSSFFHTKRDGNIPTGTPYPLTGASNARGMKNHDFRPISGFISKLMQDRAIITMEGKSKPHLTFRMVRVPFWMTLNDSYPQFQGHVII